MFASIRTVWRALRHRNRWERDLNDELQQHLERRAGDLVKAGAAPEEARRRARIELGIERVKENCRDAHRFAPLEELRQDLRYGARSLAANPLFATVAVLTLALGIGANTTIFSLINALLLRPLPIKEPDRLMVVQELNKRNGRYRNPTAAMYLDWKKHARTFQSMALSELWSDPETLTGMDRAERVGASTASPELFHVAGIQPVLGRAFLSDPVADQGAAVMTDGFWRRKFSADPKVLGQSFLVGGKPRTIVGVLPPGFALSPFDMGTDLWFPNDPGSIPKTRWLAVLGRLKPGVTLAQAEAELKSIARDQPKDRDWTIKVQSLSEYNVGGMFREIVLTLLGAVGFVLLIGCVNVSNLLLARAAFRQKEMAIRVSVGAGSFRLLRQLLTESMMIATAACLLGALLAMWGIRALVASKPFGFDQMLSVETDWRVLTFTAVCSILSGLLIGLVPAVRASKPDLNEALKEGGRQSSGLRQGGQNLLLVAEVALAMVLLVGAGLLMNSFLRLMNVDVGYNPRNVLEAEVFLAGPKYFQELPGNLKKVTPQGNVYFDQVLERLQATPGVVSVSVSSLGWDRAVTVVGRPVPEGRRPTVEYGEVSPGFFRNYEIPFRAGRCLSERDDEAAPWVAVINETMARQFFPKENPIGQQVQLSISDGFPEDRPREIVGVVADFKQYGLRSRPTPAIFGTPRQHNGTYPGSNHQSHLFKRFEIRTSGKPASLAPALQKIAADVDKDQVLMNVKTTEDRLGESVSFQRYMAWLFGAFAGMALFLAAVGIYGVVSCVVGRRTHELGIRIALGAGRGDLVRLVLGRGLRSTLIGLALGIAASLALTRLLVRLLYQVKPTDPLTYSAVMLILAAVALTACYLPARRATRVDPIVALRHE